MVLCDIHKYRSWRNYLKGLYDGKPASRKILVTGSARLDLYRYAGDSLQGRDISLHYFRDTDGREVDFIVAEKREPFMAVECKRSPVPVDRHLRYWKARFPKCDVWQLSATGTKDFVTPDGIRVCHALELLGKLV